MHVLEDRCTVLGFPVDLSLLGKGGSRILDLFPQLGAFVIAMDLGRARKAIFSETLAGGSGLPQFTPCFSKPVKPDVASMTAGVLPVAMGSRSWNEFIF